MEDNTGPTIQWERTPDLHHYTPHIRWAVIKNNIRHGRQPNPILFILLKNGRLLKKPVALITHSLSQSPNLCSGSSLGSINQYILDLFQFLDGAVMLLSRISGRRSGYFRTRRSSQLRPLSYRRRLRTMDVRFDGVLQMGGQYIGRRQATAGA